MRRLHARTHNSDQISKRNDPARGGFETSHKSHHKVSHLAMLRSLCVHRRSAGMRANERSLLRKASHAIGSASRPDLPLHSASVECRAVGSCGGTSHARCSSGSASDRGGPLERASTRVLDAPSTLMSAALAIVRSRSSRRSLLMLCAARNLALRPRIDREETPSIRRSRNFDCELS